MADLSPRDAVFVARYVLTSNAEQSARDAGFSAAFARKSAYRLLRKPAIKEALDQMRSEVRDTSRLSLGEYMVKLEAALILATAAKQHSACAKLLELQGKVAGLLVDRLAVEHIPLDLADAVRRSINYNVHGPLYDPSKVIDAAHRIVAPAHAHAHAQEVDPFT